MTAEGMYTIKEAAKKVHVEAHALRYWEEELGLSISRNDQGYRQYSEEDMELLERIRQWKEKGMQLKAIRLMLSENGRLSVPQEIVREAQSMLEKGDAGAAAGTRTVCVYIRQFGYASFAACAHTGRCRYGGEHPFG